MSMAIEIGQIEAIFRYPVKSMAGERLDFANLGWHGIEGDRRLALRCTQQQSSFPWLTATKVPSLVLFTPLRLNKSEDEIPSHIRTPEGDEMAVFGEELTKEIERRHRTPIQMTHLRAGIFDDATVSVITSETIQEIGKLSGTATDARRFRPNIVVRLSRPNPFAEEKWLGGVLMFGDADEGPRVSVTMNDARCSMVNLDPDSARSTPEVLKAIVRTNQNNAGIYGTVIRVGQLAAGQSVRFQAIDEK